MSRLFSRRSALASFAVLSLGSGCVACLGQGGPAGATSSGVRSSGNPAALDGGVTPPSPGGIAGRVTGIAGDSKVCVSAGLLRPDAGGGPGQGASGAAAIAGRGGNFRIGGLRPGTYEISASACPSLAPRSAPRLIAHRIVRVFPGIVSPVSLQSLAGRASAHVPSSPTAGGTITGLVEQRNGTRLHGVCVAAVSGTTVLEAVSGTLGRYSISSVPAGAYTVVADPCQTGVNVAPAVVGTVSVPASGGRHVVNVTMRVGAIITGTVTSAQHARLGGMCVTTVPIAPAKVPLAESAALLEIGPSFLTPAATATNGTYTVSQLPPWAFVVSFSSGCGNNGNWVTDYTPGTPYPWLSSPVPVQGGKTTTESAALEPGASLIGSVHLRHADATTLKGMCVEAGPPTTVGKPRDTLTGRRSLALGYFTAPISGTGRFDLRGVPAGAFSVMTVPDCYVHRSVATLDYFGNTPASPGRLVSVTLGEQVRHLRFRVTDGVHVTGVIRSAGVPVTHTVFCMTFQRPRNSRTIISALITSSGHGRYRVAELPPGRWLVRLQTCRPGTYAPSWYGGAVDPSGAIPISFHAGTTARHVRFDLRRAASISGVVRKPNGKLLRGACVTASAPGEYSFAISHRRGGYHLTGLGTGTYKVSVSRCDGVTRLAGVVRGGVPATAGLLTRNVDFQMTKGASIWGIVTNRNYSALPAECIVTRTPHGTFAPTAESQSDGSFYLFGLPAGRDSLHISPLCSAQVGYGPKLVGRYDLTAGSNTYTGRVRLSRDGEISGVVTAAASGSAPPSPLGGACVVAFPVGKAKAHAPAELAETGTGGKYVLTQMQPGRYDVEFRSGCGAAGYQSQWWKAAAQRSASKPVAVANSRNHRGISATLSKS